jgi:hypothetical protein
MVGRAGAHLLKGTAATAGRAIMVRIATGHSIRIINSLRLKPRTIKTAICTHGSGSYSLVLESGYFFWLGVGLFVLGGKLLCKVFPPQGEPLIQRGLFSTRSSGR